ncbi:MAG: hypothetical protein ACRDK0_12400 [Solirubrobacteraceae bacterium]
MVRTNNLVDFRPLHQETIVPSGPGHFRMVLMPGDCRRTKRDIGRIVRALETKLVEFPDDREPADGATWL